MTRIRLKRRLTRPLLALILVAMLTVSVFAQGNVTLNIDSMESGSGDTMNAYVTVRDENGVPVSGLAPENFAIVEDQRTSFPPDTISTRINPRAALSVALVIDLSGTMRDQALTEARAASQRLLEALLDEPNDPDRAAFFGISGPVDIKDLSIRDDREIGFTNDRNRILNQINVSEGAAGVATPLYDALFRVIKITARQQGPRAIIVLTDGQDIRVSKMTADDPISEANRNNIPIFPIGFSKGTINDAYLTRLAARTGGTYARAARADELTGLFQDTLNKLSEQYVLTYRTRLTRDTQPHAVIIRLDSPKGKAFDDEIFMFRDVPTAQPTNVPEATPIPTTESAGGVVSPEVTITEQPPPPTPVPTPEPFPRNVITALKDYVTNRDNLPILIGIIAGLVLLLALIIFLIIRRNRAAQGSLDEEYYRDGTSGVAYEPPTAGGPGMLPPDMSAGSYPPTVGPYPAASDATQAPPASQPFPPGAFPPPTERGPGAPVEGGTVILQRGPKVQVVAILVNRKQMQQRYDVLPSTDIGRANTNTIVLQDTTISRNHAKIKQEKGEFMLFDLGSANGTHVNDKRVTDPVALKDGDVVRFGELEFLFRRLD